MGIQCALKAEGCRDARFNADPRVHDAPFVESAEHEWTVARLGHTYGFALDMEGVGDVPEDLRTESFFSGRTWSRTWYYGDAFARFASDIVLEFRLRTGYNQRNPSYICAP